VKVESALLLGSLRHLARPAGVPPLPPIRSLAYFQPVIQELLAHPEPDNYIEYLRLKMRRFAGVKAVRRIFRNRRFQMIANRQADTFPIFRVYSLRRVTRQRVDREAEIVVGVEMTRPCETAPSLGSPRSSKHSPIYVLCSCRMGPNIPAART
jgi:hypothetical protein